MFGLGKKKKSAWCPLCRRSSRQCICVACICGKGPRASTAYDHKRGQNDDKPAPMRLDVLTPIVDTQPVELLNRFNNVPAEPQEQEPKDALLDDWPEVDDSWQ